MTRSDWILIVIVVSISLLLLGLRWLPVTGDQTRARVELEGRIFQEINLQVVDGSVVTIPLKQGKAQLEVKGGAVRLLPMPDSVCPRQICSHTGWIRRGGETIICVPNRLVIRLIGSDQNGLKVDAVTK